MNLNWNKSTIRYWVPVSARFQEAFITPMSTPIKPRWANGFGVAHLQAETVPVNLTGSESAQWLFRSNVCNVRKAQCLGAFITPVGTPISPRWAIDQAVAHLQAGTVGMKCIWKELGKWLHISGVRKVWDVQTGGERMDGRRQFHSLPLPSERAGNNKYPFIQKTFSNAFFGITIGMFD